MNNFWFKKIFLIGLNLILVLALLGPLSAVWGADWSKLKNELGENFRPGEVLVKLKNRDKIYRLKFNTKEDLSRIIKTYEANPLVESAEPNYLYQATILAPNDPFYYEQANYLNQINVQRAWDQTTGSEEIVIAVLDSGVDIDHVDLKDNIWQNPKEIAGDGLDNDKNGYVDDVNGWDFVLDKNDPRPKFEVGCLEKKTCSRGGVNHGTIVAGIIAARGNNGIGVTGVSWRSKIMPLRVLDSTGTGDTYAVARAIDYAVRNGARIINLSFVGSDYSQILADALRRAYEAGVIVVAAAGNETNPAKVVDLDKEKMYPICYRGSQGEHWVIGVASVDYQNRKTFFSNYGRDCVDLAAPGIGFFSTEVYNTPDSDFAYPYGGFWSGTSLSVPLVSGTIALMESKNPSLKPADLIDDLLNSTTEIDSLNLDYLGKLGRGLLDVNRALLAVTGAIASDSPANLARLVVSHQSGFTSEISLVDSINKLIRYQFLAFDPDFRGGISIATGDVFGDGEPEIITGVLSGGGPLIKIFDRLGNLKKQFFAFDKNFRGGVNVATVDLNGDGVKEILVAPASGGGPQVKVFDGDGKLRLQFFAFDKNFRGGVNLAAGDVDNDGWQEIIVGAGKGGGPHVRIFDKDGYLRNQFYAYNRDFRGGVKLAVITNH